MSNYGRNFYFAQPPEGNEREGRYSIAASVPIGAPVVIASSGDATDDLGLTRMELAAEGAATPLPGLGGIAVYEQTYTAFHGVDPLVTSYSDLGDVPAGSAIQVIQGTARVGYINTEDDSFFGQRDYDGRVMVAGLGATPTLEVHDMLTVGAGDGTDGYWKKTTDASLCWLVVTSITNGRVEARLNF